MLAGVVGLRPRAPRSGTVAGMGDTGDVRLRAIAQLALAVETGGDVDGAVQAAYLAGVEPSEIAKLDEAKQGQLPSLRTLGGHRRFRRSDIEPHLLAVE